MRILQLLAVKLLGLAIMTGGGLLVAYRFVPRIPEITHQLVALVSPANFPLDYIILIPLGALLFVAGFLTLIPRLPRKTKRGYITFRGAHGDVRIDLDSIEVNLNKAVSKLSEVKKIEVKVFPTANGSSVQITGEVVLYKEPGVGALATLNYVRECVEMTAQGILGVNEVTSVELTVTDVVQRKGDADKEAALLVRPRDVTRAQLPGYGEVSPAARIGHDTQVAAEEEAESAGQEPEESVSEEQARPSPSESNPDTPPDGEGELSDEPQDPDRERPATG